jgi:hypothetical protein
MGFGAELGVGLAAADLTEMDVDEVVGVDLRLSAREELLPGVLGHGDVVDLGERGELLGAGSGEVDLLCGELVVHGRGCEVARPEGEATHEREDADQSHLKNEDPPAKSACHGRVPLMCICSSPCDPIRTCSPRAMG